MISKVGAVINIISCKSGKHCKVLRNLNYHNLSKSNSLNLVRRGGEKSTEPEREKPQTIFYLHSGVGFGLFSSQYLFKLFLLLFPLCEPPLNFFF